MDEFKKIELKKIEFIKKLKIIKKIIIEKNLKK